MAKMKLKTQNLAFTIAAAVFIVLISTFVVATNMGTRGCCVNPPCTECFKETGFCVCDFREMLGFQTCDECAARGCGSFTANGTEMCHIE